jgi:outer membrane protein TolC
MLRKLIVYLVLVSAATSKAAAQTSFHSLEEVWAYADQHNVTIRNAQYESTKAQDSRKQAYMAFLPQAGITGSFTDNMSLQTQLLPAVIFGGPAGTYKAVQFGQKYIYNGGFTANLDILNLQTWFNVKLAQQSEALNNANTANARKSVYQQLAQQFYSYLLMKEAERISLNSKQVADSIFVSMSNKFAQGIVNKSNLDVAQINMERTGQNYITAACQSATALNSLKGLLGMSLSDSMAIEATMQSGLPTNAIASFSDDPSILVAKYQTDLSLTSLKAARSSFAPTISVNYSNSTQQNDNKFEPFQGGPSWYPAQFWALKANWNIFASCTRWLNVRKGKISLQQSQMQLEYAIKQSAINDENLRLNYIKAKSVVARSQNVMNLSLDNYTHITYRYETGVANIEDRLTAFTDYLNYQNQYLNALSDLFIQVFQLKIRQQTF